MGRAARLVVAAVVITVTLAPAADATAGTPRAGEAPALPALPSLDPGSPSLSAGGRAMLEAAPLEDAPRYALGVTVEPGTGNVEGRMHARVQRPDDGAAEFRVLPGLPALHAGLRVRNVTVNDKAVNAEVDRALLRVPVKRAESNAVDVRLQFSYRVPRSGPSGGRPLSQETIGVLSRSRDVMLLGHWFPVWLPPGADADPGLSGFGDIGNFAAGAITARVDVPTGYDVRSGGVNAGRIDKGSRTIVTESGVGPRDLALFVGRDRRNAETSTGDVTVRATGAAGLDLEDAARQSADDVQALTDLYSPYPWSEVDVVSAPLGPGIGGMEWPGMVWVAGIGEGSLGGASLALAHELAHQWWHALVGNDSIRAPVVDEPLAQYSMCLVTARQQIGDVECVGLGRGTLGRSPRDACADRPTNRFRSAEQYGLLVYNQAPGFYFALADAVGQVATVAALRSVVARHAFGILTPEQLHDEFVAAFPDRAAEVRDLWDRYIGPSGCGGSRGSGQPAATAVLPTVVAGAGARDGD
jgi:hypothetical protein